MALLVLLAVFWNWDWFIPIVQTQASAALGRAVTIGHLHVRIYPTVQVAADDVVIANPPGWRQDDPPLATIGVLTVQAEPWAYLRGGGLVLPLIAIDRPIVYAAETADGGSNFRFPSGGPSAAPPRIGDLRIADGKARVVIPRLRADFETIIATREATDGASEIVATATGTYAGQPIEAHAVGGALLSLRDKEHPWPIDLTVANGPTRVALKGTIEDPMALAGADLMLRFAGPDLGRLEPLVGFPIPQTPAYDISGRLNFVGGLSRIRFENFHGRLGSSDLEGTIEEQPEAAQSGGTAKPDVTMDLRSNQVDLADLKGFIGGTPGRTTTANATPQEREAAARAKASARLLPETPISIPRLNWADIHLHYRGAHIEGRDVPLDNLSVAMDVVDGRITLHPISFAVGKGTLSGNVELTPTSDKMVRAKIDLHLRNVDVSRLMAATHAFEGAGSISGVGAIDSTGDSMASILANGNGGLKMAMAGGDLSAVLVDLTGLEFGKALLSALGVPEKTPVHCFVGDLDLRRGDLDFAAMTLDTGEAIVNVGGDVNLASEVIDLHLKTDSKHFSIGSLPTRINIGGTLKDPHIRPGAEVVARAGAAAGLAVLFAPLAILPTVQFGTSDAEDARCEDLLRQARAAVGGKALPGLPRAGKVEHSPHAIR